MRDGEPQRDQEQAVVVHDAVLDVNVLAQIRADRVGEQHAHARGS